MQLAGGTRRVDGVRVSRCFAVCAVHNTMLLRSLPNRHACNLANLQQLVSNGCFKSCGFCAYSEFTASARALNAA